MAEKRPQNNASNPSQNETSSIENQTKTMIIGLVIIICAIIFAAVFFSHQRQLEIEKQNAEQKLQIYENTEDFLLYGGDKETEDPDAFWLKASTVAKNNFVSFAGRKGTYTFSLEQQPESINGICLAPAYTEATSSNKIGLLLTCDNCITGISPQADSTQTIAASSIVQLSPYFGLTPRNSAEFKNEHDYGVIWTMEAWQEDQFTQEDSRIIARAIDLETKEVLDIIQLTFGVNTEGCYQLLTATDPTCKDQDLRLEIGAFLNRLFNTNMKNASLPGLGWESSLDYTTSAGQQTFFIQKISAPYEANYIDAETGTPKSSIYLEAEKESLYAVTLNVNQTIGIYTLYLSVASNEIHLLGYNTIY